MRKYILTLNIAIIGLIFMGAGCVNNQTDTTNTTSNNNAPVVQTNNNENTTSTNRGENKEYVWTRGNIRFNYPKNYNIITEEDTLYLSLDSSLPEGESRLLYSRIIDSYGTVESFVKEQLSTPNFSQTTEVINGRTFTKTQYTEPVTGKNVVTYIISQNNPEFNKIIYYIVGTGGQDLAKLVLSTLKF